MCLMIGNSATHDTKEVSMKSPCLLPSTCFFPSSSAISCILVYNIYIGTTIVATRMMDASKVIKMIQNANHANPLFVFECFEGF